METMYKNSLREWWWENDVETSLNDNKENLKKQIDIY